MHLKVLDAAELLGVPPRPSTDGPRIKKYRTHLLIHARLSFALKDPLFRQAVLGRETRQRILDRLRAIESRIPHGTKLSPVC